MGLDSVEIVLGWEDAFQISISDEEAALLSTPAQAIDLIGSKLHAAGSLKASGEAWRRDEIRTVVRGIIAEVNGTDEFNDDDDFVYDLGIDR